MANKTDFDWNELAFSSKKSVKDLGAIFIMAPREISQERFVQLVKNYLPKANLLVGISKEPYVLGIEDQPQFRMLELATVEPIINKVNQSPSKHRIYTLSYSQRDFRFIIEKIKFQKVLLINGSWYHGFHHSPEYYSLVKAGVTFEKLSPFVSENEAKSYAAAIKFPKLPSHQEFTELEMMELARQAARRSFDYAGFQTGGVVAVKSGAKYKQIAAAHNQIVPYETFAMHNGSVREENFSPLNDLNHYDTIHYEVALMLQMLEAKKSLDKATIFETVLSCPHCARMLAASKIAEVVYAEDHSNGYAVKLLESAGKKVRRLV